MQTVSISEARADLAGIVRRLTAEPAGAVGITVNGRLEAVVSTPGRSGDAPAGWIYTGRHPASRLPDDLRELVPADVRYDDRAATVWVHAASGAIALLVPSAPWNSVGRPQAWYLAPDRSLRLPLNLEDVPGWDGDSPSAYHDTLDSARRYVARVLSD